MQENKISFINHLGVLIIIPLLLGELHQFVTSSSRAADNVEVETARKVSQISISDISNYTRDKILFVDARSRELYREAHVVSAISVQPSSFDVDAAENLEKILNQEIIIVYCSSAECKVSDIVARKFIDIGINAVVLEEGWEGWLAMKLPITMKVGL